MATGLQWGRLGQGSEATLDREDQASQTGCGILELRSVPGLWDFASGSCQSCVRKAEGCWSLPTARPSLLDAMGSHACLTLALWRDLPTAPHKCACSVPHLRPKSSPTEHSKELESCSPWDMGPHATSPSHAT